MSDSVGIDIQTPLWMRYSKCPICGKYVINPPLISRKRRGGWVDIFQVCWNYELKIYLKMGLLPCVKCLNDKAVISKKAFLPKVRHLLD